MAQATQIKVEPVHIYSCILCPVVCQARKKKTVKQQNETVAKETIKVLFMYIMIHKLDLYINIAFHPNND